MRSFNVYKHPTYGYKAVKQGFNGIMLVASIFPLVGIVWLAIQKMWKCLFLWFFSIFSFYYLSDLLAEALIGGIYTDDVGLLLAFFNILCLMGYFSICVVTAKKVNSWVENGLKNRGYAFVCTIQADNSDAALSMMISGDSFSDSKKGDAVAENIKSEDVKVNYPTHSQEWLSVAPKSQEVIAHRSPTQKNKSKLKAKLVVIELVEGAFGWAWIIFSLLSIYSLGMAVFSNGKWSDFFWCFIAGGVAKWLSKGFRDNKIRIAYEADLVSKGYTVEEAGKKWAEEYLR